jgi:hypothetical protein
MNKNNSSEEIDNTKLIISELIDLLNDEKSYRDIVISTEITKTIHLLIKQGGSRRNEIISHPYVSSSIRLC